MLVSAVQQSESTICTQISALFFFFDFLPPEVTPGHWVEVPELCSGFSSVTDFMCVSESATPWTVAHQAPRPVDFPGRNTEGSCPFLLQGIFLDHGTLLHTASVACICQSHLPFHPVTVPPHLGIQTFVYYSLRLSVLWLCGYSGSGLWITGHLAASLAPAH